MGLTPSLDPRAVTVSSDEGEPCSRATHPPERGDPIRGRTAIDSMAGAVPGSRSPQHMGGSGVGVLSSPPARGTSVLANRGSALWLRWLVLLLCVAPSLPAAQPPSFPYQLLGVGQGGRPPSPLGRHALAKHASVEGVGDVRQEAGEERAEWWQHAAPWHRRAPRRKPRRRPASLLQLTAAATFLQHVFRRIMLRWPGGWDRGKPRPAVWRPADMPSCSNGLSLADPSSFTSQAELAAHCFRWQSQYVRILQRIESGRQPLVLDLFCGGGGSSEGVRRAGGASMGVDDSDQPSFRAKFGSSCFTLGDALDLERLRGLVRRLRPIGIIASPPCEGFSTATFAGAASTVERLIAVTRDVLEALGLPYVIENVLGARSEIRDHAIIVRGQDFGLRTERPRFLESGGGFELILDPTLAQGGGALRRGCCLGERNRYGRLDSFKMPCRVPCCRGNIFSVMGSAPYMCTEAQEAAAMGLDSGHMPHHKMSKALPPAYMEYVTGQLAMHTLRVRYGVIPISFSEMLAAPAKSRRALALLARGAGGTSPSLGMGFVP